MKPCVLSWESHRSSVSSRQHPDVSEPITSHWEESVAALTDAEPDVANALLNVLALKG